MDKIIFLTRHAEAYHNQTEDWSSASVRNLRFRAD